MEEEGGEEKGRGGRREGGEEEGRQRESMYRGGEACLWEVTSASEALFSLISREAQRTRKLTPASGRNISSKALFSYSSGNENLNGTD